MTTEERGALAARAKVAWTGARARLQTLTLAERGLVALMLVFCVVVTVKRMSPSFDPWVAETDWKQWVWQYHRYSLAGSFPEGNVLTDYAMGVQPPFFWMMMASLSTVVGPIHAAIIINIIAFVGALAACAWAAGQRTSMPLGVAAAVLLARDVTFHRVTCGGYPRSFGPALTILFLGAWLTGRHRLVLAVLVLSAGLYPSVVVPCGLAYGAWCLLSFKKPGWLRRNVELAAAGAACIVLALWQNLNAPAWWGPVVTYAEAVKMPALRHGGRTPWVPLGDFWPQVVTYLRQPFDMQGLLVQRHALPWTSATAIAAMEALTITAIVGALVIPLLKRRDGARVALPLQPFLLLCTAVLSFHLARTFAFQLYLPRRMVQHTLPYILVPTYVIAVGAAVRAISTRRAASYIALGIALLPMLVCGDGLIRTPMDSYRANAQLYQYLDANTPLQATFGGYVEVLDQVPLFARRQVYVNWKMAHPFRKGYYAEIERRIMTMYDAYYANDVEQVLDIAAKEKIDFFVVSHRRFLQVERGDSQVFEPLRAQVLKMWEARRKQKFVLAAPPPEAVVFTMGDITVVDLAKLRAWATAHPQEAGGQAPPQPGDTAAGGDDAEDAGPGGFVDAPAPRDEPDPRE